MNACSSEGVRVASSCRAMRWVKARSPTWAAPRPVTVSVPVPSVRTSAPRAVSRCVRAPGSGVLTVTLGAVPRAAKAARDSSAISAPRPMTRIRSAVFSISRIMWLDTRTVRPSAARRRNRPRTHRTPSGSSPFSGSSNSSTGGSPSRAAAMPRRCFMPSEKPRMRRPAAPVRPTSASTSSTRPGGRALLRASTARWARAVRPPWTSAASSSAPTWRSPRGRSAKRRPATVTLPAVGRFRPRIRRRVVDLPAPLGPRNPVTCPGRTVKLSWSTAVVRP